MGIHQRPVLYMFSAVLSIASLIVGSGGCREWNDIRDDRIGVANPPHRPLRLERENAKFGMTGYEVRLGPGRTGDGRLGTAGLHAYGGGPPATFTNEPIGPTALSPNQRIGTPARVRTIRVLEDPVNGSTAIYQPKSSASKSAL